MSELTVNTTIPTTGAGTDPSSAEEPEADPAASEAPSAPLRRPAQREKRNTVPKIPTHQK